MKLFKIKYLLNERIQIMIAILLFAISNFLLNKRMRYYEEIIVNMSKSSEISSEIDSIHAQIIIKYVTEFDERIDTLEYLNNLKHKQ